MSYQVRHVRSRRQSSLGIPSSDANGVMLMVIVDLSSGPAESWAIRHRRPRRPAPSTLPSTAGLTSSGVTRVSFGAVRAPSLTAVACQTT